MKVLVTGATGLVGKNLIEHLMKNDHEPVVLTTRNPDSVKISEVPLKVFQWTPRNHQMPAEAWEGVDAVIHLAGENVADGRWSEAHKQRILQSRVDTTKTLIDSIQALEAGKRPKHFISSSAVGIYGDRGDEVIDENSGHTDDFLADVCKQWEEGSRDKVEGLKTSYIRTGIVLDDQGGALKKMLLPFKMGAGGPLGNGKQFMSWVHNDDLARLFLFILEKGLEGVYNGTAPNPCDNKTFGQVLGSVLNRPAFAPLPGFVAKIMFGEMSSILLTGQRVVPKAALAEGFEFQFEHLHDALEDLLGKSVRGERVFRVKQWLPVKRNEVFSFFAEAKNLEKITPPFLNFKIRDMSTDQIEKGTIINYSLKLHFLPMNWRTEITHWNEGESFTDFQQKGPYQKWDHTHSFFDYKGGTLVDDYVVYKLPFGFLGDFFGNWYVKRDVNKIFGYRTNVIGSLFESKPTTEAKAS
jgi:uncharacterized protein (TIGR01777 family)